MTEIIILAAGKGKRMKGSVSKVLTPILGRPMISYLLDSIKEFDRNIKPIIIVSQDNKEEIKEALKAYNFRTATQLQIQGTGQAVLSAKDEVSKLAKKILVLNGDHPFIPAYSISSLLSKHDGLLSIMSVKLKDFSSWRQNFYHWGRLFRNGESNLEKIIEFKDASEEEKKILEVNPAIFCFNSQWLWKNISKLKNNNKQGEYYLTDLVKMVFDSKEKIITVPIRPEYGMGINSQEELEIVKKNILNKLIK
jgi:bifunctional UDP-N-acetylglucosamine pyrophosphorylase/glucosamine-1-phosphate N-acetyltransferase